MCKFKNEKLCEFHVKRLIEKKERNRKCINTKKNNEQTKSIM